MEPWQVLVTRPKHLADQLGKAIEAKGWQWIHFPCLAIEKITDANLANYDLLIFVSINAVLSANLSSVHSEQTVVAMGPGTQGALAQYQIKASIPHKPYSSETLLAMAQLQQINQKRIAVVAGEGGRNLITSSLAERGAMVEKIAVYRRHIPSPDPAPLKAFWLYSRRAVIATSLETLENLVALVPKEDHGQLFASLLIVPSQRIKDAGVAKRFANVRVSNSIAVDDLLNSVSDYQ